MVRVEVTNTGTRSGDEVVQLYVRDHVASVTRPVRMLKGFERVTIGPGERRAVSFTLRANDLAFYDLQMRRVVEPGTFTVYVGGSSTATGEARFRMLGETTAVPDRGPLP